MTTRSVMKAQIRLDMKRGTTLDLHLDKAIADAIDTYKDESWFFSQSRSITFPTVEDQRFYDSSDHASLAHLEKIHYMRATQSGQSCSVTPKSREWIEAANDFPTINGGPLHYSWYAEQLQLHPTPSATVWTIRIAGIFAPVAPADDNETDNPWMTTAERLIRLRTMHNLFVLPIRNYEAAAAILPQIQEAKDQLDRRSSKKNRIGRNIVEPWSL